MEMYSYKLIEAYLRNIPFVDVESLRDELVRSRKMKSIDGVWAFGLREHKNQSSGLEEVSDIPHI
jgi:hypothetical protein